VGNSTTNAVVSSADEALIRLNARNALNPAPIHFNFDLNRDRVVASSDQALARLNATNALSSLRLIVPPAQSPGASAGPSQSWAVDRFFDEAVLDRLAVSTSRRRVRM
jgi:hypothetical protein